jgi:hypothetical protein
MQLYQRAERVLLAEAPILPVAIMTGKRPVQPNLTGMHGRIVCGINFKYVALDPTVAACLWQASGS